MVIAVDEKLHVNVLYKLAFAKVGCSTDKKKKATKMQTPKYKIIWKKENDKDSSYCCAGNNRDYKGTKVPVVLIGSGSNGADGEDSEGEGW